MVVNEDVNLDVEIYEPVKQVLKFLCLDEQGEKLIMQYTESYVDDVLISKSKYMLVRDVVLKEHSLEDKSPKMLYEDYLAKYSAKLRVYDEKIKLLKDFVDLNLGYLTGIVVEPFTHNLWVTPKFYSVFSDYTKYVEHSKQQPYSVLAERFGFEDVEIYTLSMKLNLMFGNSDGMKTMTPLQYATLVVFLTNYKKVEDKGTIEYLKSTGLPYFKFRGVGVFVENSLYKYLDVRGELSVESTLVLLDIDGIKYYNEVDSLNYLLEGAKLPRLSVLGAIQRGLLQGRKWRGKVLYEVELLERLISYYKKGYNLSLAIIFARNLVGEDEFKDKYLNKYQLKKLLGVLKDKGYVTNAFMKHYTTKEVDSLTYLYGVPVYRKEQVYLDLSLHRVYSPIGSAYSKDYYNIYLVLKYLEGNKVESTEHWSMLGFSVEDGVWSYDNSVTSLGVMATPNICVLSKEYLDSDVVDAIELYIEKQRKEIYKEADEILSGISLLD